MDNPKLYRQTNQLQRHNAGEVVKEYKSKLSQYTDGGDSLIDIGSAIGDVLMEVVRPIMDRDFERIVCSDINRGMVAYAKEEFEQQVKNSEYIYLDVATKTGLPDDVKEQFHHVLSFFCLQLIPDQKNAFQNIYSLMRPEGSDCLLTIFARAPYFDAYQQLSKTSKWSEYMTEVDAYTCPWHYAKDPQAEVTRLLAEIGFSDIEVELRPSHFAYPSLSAFKSNMTAISHYIHRIPPSLHEDFIDDFTSAMMASNVGFDHFEGPEKKFRFPFEQLIIYARRKPVLQQESNGNICLDNSNSLEHFNEPQRV